MATFNRSNRSIHSALFFKKGSTTYKFIISFTLLLVLFLQAKSQPVLNIDSLKQKIKFYGLKKQSAVLFIHFDKTVYTNNDNVWFTAYLHGAVNKTRYKTLALMLFNNNDRAVIIQDKFVIKNGFAFGNTAIPDSVQAGNYTFIAYTNKMVDGHIDVVFTQPITIKKAGNIPKPADDVVKREAATITAANVSFYPEGGSMLNNALGVVGWEAKNATGTPLALTAFLYENDKIIDTVETDVAGLGKFMLRPVLNHRYYLKLFNGGTATYKLPEISAAGASISLKKAFVDDSLVVQIKNTTGQKLSIVCHNYDGTFFTAPASGAEESNITIKLNNVPRGLTQVTLIDNMGHPYAERTFFAHYNRKVMPQLSTDSRSYSKRQKVYVRIKLAGKSDSGLVSIACVEEGRIEPNKQRKIDDYVYLQHQLENAPQKPDYVFNDNNRLTRETELLIKGWKRYTWADAMKAMPADTTHVFDHIAFKGLVKLYDDRQLNRAIILNNLNKPAVKFKTDADGYFLLKDSDLVSSPGKKINFVTNDGKSKRYHIYLLDPYIEINEKLKDRFRPPNYPVAAYNNYSPIPANSGIVLKAVNIRARSKGVANICGDYVCSYDVYNCPNHRMEPSNRPAVKGEVYYIGGKLAIYTGCGGVSEHGFAGIYEAAEFYPADYEIRSPDAPEYVSTLFWKHQLKISSGTEAVVSFYTSDITGKFKIIVQGTVGDDVTYGETSFEVKPDDKKVQ